MPHRKPPHRKRPRRLDAVVVACGVLVAAVLLAWPWALDQLESSSARQHITEAAERAGALPEGERAGLLGQARAYNAALAGARTGISRAGIWPYGVQLSAGGEPMMSWLEIPSLGIGTPVYHGTSEATLMAGAGHLEGTSLPVGGSSTHCVITAHSGMRNLAMFDGIGRLEPGDTVLLHTLGETLAYRVEGSETVWPDELGTLGIERGRDLVTLVTCTPYGVNDHRLLVHCERTDLPTAGAAGERGLLERHWGAREAAALAALVALGLLAVRTAARRTRGTHLAPKAPGRGTNRRHRPAHSPRHSRKVPVESICLSTTRKQSEGDFCMGKSKRNRFIVVGGIIVIVIILAIAVVSAGTTNKTMSVAEAAQPSSHGQKVEVTGNVVDNSYTVDGDTLTFRIYDADDPQATLSVVYDQGVAATFGNGVTAICKGTIDDSGTLQCNNLVTKCPSKYETMTDALSVSRLLGYGNSVLDKPVKVEGTLKKGSLKGVDSKTRLVLVDADDKKTELKVAYEGAIPQTVKDGSRLVLTGSLDKDGSFECTNLAEAQEA